MIDAPTARRVLVHVAGRPVVLAGAAATVVVLAAVALSPVLGIPAGVGAVLVAVVLIAGTVGVVRGVPDLAAGLVLVAVGTATWNGYEIGGLQIAHGALAAAVLLLGAHAVATRRRIVLPAWVLVLGVVVVAVAATHVLAPTSDAYLASRAAVVAPPQFAGAVSSAADARTDGLLTAMRWLVAAVALPLAMVLAVASRPSLATRAVSWWAAGAAVGAVVAVTDSLALTAVSARLLGTVDIGGRQAGLSVQPNHLALGIALTVPVAVWRLLRARDGRGRTGWWIVLAADAGGLVVSGSRGGLAVAVVGVVVVLLVDRGGRRALAPTAAVVVALLTVVVAVRPSLLAELAGRLRFADDVSSTASDLQRAGLARQALADFLHAPVRGVGLQVITEGHSIYLQLLAAGGVLLLAGFVVAMVGAAVDAVVLPDRHDGLVGVLVVSLLVWLVVGVVENQLTDVFLYVPFALVAALWALRRGTGVPLPVPLPVPIPVPAHAPAPGVPR